MKQRVGWIDIAKGICLIAVILGHMGIDLLGFVYSFHLTTFFILSGYTLRKTDITYDYLRQKFSRLMIPYFITCAAVVAMDVINAIVVYHNVSTQNITHILYRGIVKTFFGSGGLLNFGSIELGMGIGAIWFLPAMFFALIVVQLVLRLRSKVIQAIIAGVMFLLSAITATVFWLPFSIQAALFSVPFILIGKWIKEYEILEKLKWWHYIILFAVFIGGCHFNVAQVFYIVSCTAKDWIFTPLCAICSSLCVIGLSRLIKRCSPLEFVGKNSLIFLCVHLFQINTLPKYFEKARELLHLPYTFVPRFIMEMLFVTTVSSVIIWFSSHRKNKPLTTHGNRDRSIDIMRTALIILMIIDHTMIDAGFSRFIYSFHMMAFVMVSGYFYNSNLPVLTNIKKTLRTLLPYATFGVLYVFFTHAGWRTEIKTIMLGISFTKEILPNVSSVGPVYFILMLCIVKIAYIPISYIGKPLLKNAVVLLLFCAGLLFGHYGIWLPWTIDGALFSLLFYHIAHSFKKYDLLKKCTLLPPIYFPLSCIWAFMIYSGSMEPALRKYGNIGLTVAGVISAFIISYLLCHYLAEQLPRWASWTVGLIGQSTAYILILNTLFHDHISNYATNSLGLQPQNIFHLAFCVIVQVTLGAVCCFVIDQIKKHLNFANKQI